VIGKGGKGVEDLKKGKPADRKGAAPFPASCTTPTRADDIVIDVQEVRKPDTNAQLVSETVATQLERRVSFRRAMKKAVSRR
jgi:small subunit ribosomal protein S3